MQGISGGQGISPWSDLDVLTLDLVGQRLDIDQLLLPRCYQNTPYQEHPCAPSVSPNPRVFVGIGPRRVCHYCAKTIERGGRPTEEDQTLEERQPPGNSGISLGGVR